MVTLFKDGSSTLEQGLDLARRRDFNRAREKFVEAYRKLSKEGRILDANLAKAYADLLSPEVVHGHSPSLIALSSFLRSSLGTTELRLGARGISAADLATQLELTARESQLGALLQSGPSNPEGLAQALQALATEYSQLGNRVLYLPELFEQRAVTADTKFPGLMALSFETLGTALQATDPLTAAERFQTAQHYWTQANDVTRAQAVATRAGHLAIQAKCWFCGREGRGFGVQFASLPLDQDVMGLKGMESSPLPSLDPSGRKVYVCKGCYSALNGLADRIAVQRASEVEQLLLAEMRAMEQRLQSPRK
jgi:hypothetical protein